MATSAASTTDGSHDEHHGLKLWPFFLALLALTACEVGLYEAWRSSATEVDGEKVYFIPKFALIWLIMVFTLPKAYIVLVFFMHLKFEKLIVVGLALAPFLFAGLCVLPTLTDTATLNERKTNTQEVIGFYGKERQKQIQKQQSGDAAGKATDSSPGSGSDSSPYGDDAGPYGDE